MMPSAEVTWKSLVLDVVRRQGRYFTLSDVLSHSAELASKYPSNRFVAAKIRQSLQVLRDQGVLRFFGGGRYERLDVEPRFSPFFDPEVASTYSSRAQIARVAIETWAELNLYCLACAADALRKLPANTPVADFDCPRCNARYQIKAKDGRMSSKIIGSAYGPTVAAARANEFPELVLVEFDSRRSTVVYVDGFPGRLIGESRILPRARLSQTARRAGWQGCAIDIGGLAPIAVVRPQVVPPDDVRREWQATREHDRP